ncbi:hypothetical protein BGX34_003475 [Mortierella sp. NVP85]|nr:hypothetical protein BGX34_003475 [Mortierella sp. NVP85]
MMQELFKKNFDKLQGDEWLSPSGASFDHRRPAETALPSIYNKGPEELEELFAEKGWRVDAALTEKLSEEFQRLVFECVQQLLKVYRVERMALPQAPHESWAVNCLWSFIVDALRSQYVGYQPGKYHS